MIHDCSFKLASESDLTKKIQIAYNIFCMKSTPYSSFVGLMITSFFLSSCGSKEGKLPQLGVTESSVENVAFKVCTGFLLHLLEKNIVDAQNEERLEELNRACTEIIERSAQTGAGPKRFQEKELARTVAYEFMNDAWSPSGKIGGSWGAEGRDLTEKFVNEMLEHGKDLQPCEMGSPECR